VKKVGETPEVPERQWRFDAPGSRARRGACGRRLIEADPEGCDSPGAVAGRVEGQEVDPGPVAAVEGEREVVDGPTATQGVVEELGEGL